MAISHFRPVSSPWQALQQLRDEMDGLLGPILRSSSAEWSPPIQLEDHDDEIVLTAELPGMRRDDIEIEIEGDLLTLRGEKKEEHKEKEGERYLYERRYGNFVRRLTLPHIVDPDRSSARFDDGVLRVTMPKAEGTRGKRIRVEETH